MRDITITTGGTREDYLKELGEFLVDASTRRVVMTAQGKAINMLVDVVLVFRNNNAKLVKIDDISISTVRALRVQATSYTKNVSQMKIVLMKHETVKE